jgi:hypothetical protein
MVYIQAGQRIQSVIFLYSRGCKLQLAIRLIIEKKLFQDNDDDLFWLINDHTYLKGMDMNIRPYSAM